MPENAQLSVRRADLEVAMVGREPLIDDALDLERTIAKPESTRRLLALVSRVAFNGNLKDRSVGSHSAIIAHAKSTRPDEL